MTVCEHGASRSWWWDMLRGGPTGLASWSGPLSTCGCCGAEFGYLESGQIDGRGFGGTTWRPRDRCARCGGKLERFGTFAAKEQGE